MGADWPILNAWAIFLQSKEVHNNDINIKIYAITRL